jgi:hypothetical protein
MAGIQETKEAIAAIGVLVRTVKELGKDGFQFDDAMALADKFSNDPAFAKKLTDGAMGIELVANELSDISFFEGLDLLKQLSAEFKALKG